MITLSQLLNLAIVSPNNRVLLVSADKNSKMAWTCNAVVPLINSLSENILKSQVVAWEIRTDKCGENPFLTIYIVFNE